MLLVCGYGSGISAHVAQRFGKEGFRVAIVSRNQEKLDAAVEGACVVCRRRAAPPPVAQVL